MFSADEDALREEDGVDAGIELSSSRSASSSAENKKAQGRWSKEEEKLLVQLWAEITRRSQHGIVFCSQILFLSV